MPDLSKRKEKGPINKIMKERRQIITNTEEIQTIIRMYYEQLYANKLGNLEEMDAFPETCKWPKLKQEEIENLNRPITSKEIKAAVKNLPTSRAQGQMASQGSSTKYLKKN